MAYFLLMLALMTSAFAELDKIQIKNLDLNYVYPEGSGEFEKLIISIEKKQTYPIQIYRRDKTFDIISPFVEFQWLNPIAFVHNAQKIAAKKLNLNLGHLEHSLRGESLGLIQEKGGEILLDQYSVSCAGSSAEKDPIKRILKDCMDKMDITISHMELPFEFLTSLATQLPDVPTEAENEMPANDFYLTNVKGDFYSYVRIKYVIKAYLKIWGHAQIENDGKTFAVRMDKIMYGILPVTNLVMNELQRQIKHPDVTIDPPWIRIKMDNK